ncbi:MAG: polyphenol oxidase family protein [Actinomycetota bacterium]|nr:polyphenol oxidase family protein [Actinomycetota bacterium]
MARTLDGGAAFSEASDGDIRGSLDARASLSEALGISADWATVTQVHGSRVVRASAPGLLGEADAIWTTVRDLPLAVFTADCYGVVLASASSTGVAHVGWRGARSGIVSALRAEMSNYGEPVTRAAMGPGIAGCCFEVGEDVLAEFPEDAAMTTWGTNSVDLPRFIDRELEGLEVWGVSDCTRHDEGWFSHRGSGTLERLATVGWLT